MTTPPASPLPPATRRLRAATFALSALAIALLTGASAAPPSELPVQFPDILRIGGGWVGVLAGAWLADFVAKRILVKAVRALIQRTDAKWDDVLIEHRVFERLAHVAPAVVLHASAPLLFEDGSSSVEFVRRFANVWIILATARALDALLNSLVTLGRRTESTKDKPVRSYVQVAKIVLWATALILLVATILDRSPWALLTGLGAMTAILILVFKDSILGFVASIQIAANDMVRVGDWISMDTYGADGDVIDIGLHTVKVQNWDKTVSTIPTPAFMSDSFKNWRGMTESGGRRIKRSLSIDMTSVRFLRAEDLERLGRVELLKNYLGARASEIVEFNEKASVDASSPANGRCMTNLGTLRAYMAAYLASLPNISTSMTFLVRQLAPTTEGIPIEIYVFSREQRWVQYEALIGDIFDHLLAVLPEFDIRPFQKPSGTDFRSLTDPQPGA